MDKMRLLLTIITVAIVAVPILGMLLTNQNNLLGLVIPPQLSDLAESRLEPPTFVDSQYDAASRTVALTFSFKNPFKADLTINSMSANLVCDEHNFPLGNAVLDKPVSMGAGETAMVTIFGTWTEEALAHFHSAHGGDKTIDVELVNLAVNFKGMTVHTDQPIPVKDVPLP
jgi:hypothetical protein